MSRTMTAEHRRLADSESRRADWKHWGPYLSERAWGTVREDYSATGDAWDYVPHDHARSRTYRWNWVHPHLKLSVQSLFGRLASVTPEETQQQSARHVSYSASSASMVAVLGDALPFR